MPTKISENSLTIREMMQLTYNTEKRNRINFMKRDVMKFYRMEKVTQFQKDRILMPEIKYRLMSFSYPQYKPYINVKGKKASKQRKIKHEYDIVFEFSFLSIDSPFRWRVGSQKIWKEKVPQSMVKQIYRETLAKWKKQFTKNGRLDNKALQAKKTAHRKQAIYLNCGDFNSRAGGVNGDFRFRLEPLLAQRGMLFGRCMNRDIPEGGHLFLDKHSMNFILQLIAKGILKEGI